MQSLNISLYQLQVFVKAADLLSFSAAAADFNVTPSAISKSVAAMEAVLGFPLFIRSGSKLELTVSGKYLFEHWKDLAISLESTVDKAEQLFRRGTSSLTIGLPDSLGRGPETEYLKAFQSRHPEIQLFYHAIHSNQLISRLQMGDVDLILTGLYECKSLDRLGIPWKNYADVPDVAIMHRSNPLAQRQELTIHDLKEERFLMLFPSENASYFERVYALCSNAGFQPQIATFLPSFQSMLEHLLRNQQGIMISNRFIINADHPELRCFELADTNAGMVIAWKVSFPNKPLQQLVSLFPSCSQSESF